MKYLAELEPSLFRFQRSAAGISFVPAATLAEAQGVEFECPKWALLQFEIHPGTASLEGR